MKTQAMKTEKSEKSKSRERRFSEFNNQQQKTKMQTLCEQGRGEGKREREKKRKTSLAPHTFGGALPFEFPVRTRENRARSTSKQF